MKIRKINQGEKEMNHIKKKEIVECDQKNHTSEIKNKGNCTMTNGKNIIESMNNTEKKKKKRNRKKNKKKNNEVDKKTLEMIQESIHTKLEEALYKEKSKDKTKEMKDVIKIQQVEVNKNQKNVQNKQNIPINVSNSKSAKKEKAKYTTMISKVPTKKTIEKNETIQKKIQQKPTIRLETFEKEKKRKIVETENSSTVKKSNTVTYYTLLPKKYKSDIPQGDSVRKFVWGQDDLSTASLQVLGETSSCFPKINLNNSINKNNEFMKNSLEKDHHVSIGTQSAQIRREFFFNQNKNLNSHKEKCNNDIRTILFIDEVEEENNRTSQVRLHNKNEKEKKKEMDDLYELILNELTNESTVIKQKKETYNKRKKKKREIFKEYDKKECEDFIRMCMKLKNDIEKNSLILQNTFNHLFNEYMFLKKYLQSKYNICRKVLFFFRCTHYIKKLKSLLYIFYSALQNSDEDLVLELYKEIKKNLKLLIYIGRSLSNYLTNIAYGSLLYVIMVCLGRIHSIFNCFLESEPFKSIIPELLTIIQNI